MQLRWSEEAADDLERITNYLFEETPQHAPELVRDTPPTPCCNFPIAGVPARKRERGKWCFHRCPTSWFIESPVTPSTTYEFCMARRNGLSASATPRFTHADVHTFARLTLRLAIKGKWNAVAGRPDALVTA
jgi:hypothetical protein